MTVISAEEKQSILNNAKEFFRERIVQNHIANTRKLIKLSAFDVNPFLCKYLAQFAFGDSTPENMAKALIYPRVLGTSITTSFGTNMQFFCSEVLKAFGSTTEGIDIEFKDALDNTKKYCQVKAGPNCINKDDKRTIINHFKNTRQLARANGITLRNDDFVLGVLYGTYESLNTFYKEIEEDGYLVFVGEQFWHHLTGDQHFYEDLISAFADVAGEMDSSTLLKDTIKNLAFDIKEYQQNN